MAATKDSLDLCARQLRVIIDIDELAAEQCLGAWLCGGWAVDFVLGEITREHANVDWFVRAEDAGRLVDSMVDAGYQLVMRPATPGRQLSLVLDGVEVDIGLLAGGPGGRVVVAGGGPWAGREWPESLLDGSVGRIGRVRCPIISPAAQIEIKRTMPVWAPGLRRRDKDDADIARLRAALSAAA